MKNKEETIREIRILILRIMVISKKEVHYVFNSSSDIK